MSKKLKIYIVLLCVALSSNHAKSQSEVLDHNKDKGVMDTVTQVLTITPNSHSEESFHVEYPAVYKINERMAMLYSAFGADRRWRIKLALSKDGFSWVRQGNIFAEKQLTFPGNYAFPFVEEKYPGFSMIFVASSNHPDKKGYTVLWQSFSPNGMQWQQPKKIIEDNLILDPVLTNFNGQQVALYTSAQDNQSVIKMLAMEQNSLSTKPRVIYKAQGAEGLYTLGIFLMDKKPIVVIEIGSNKDTEWQAKCFDKDGRLISAATEPLLITSNHGEKWDALKYGPYFFQNDNQNTLVYFNGIKGRGEEKGGQIGVASINEKLLKDIVITKNCH